jgi:hypothetical protein
VVAAGTTHDDLLLSRGFFAPQQLKSSHKRLFGYPGATAMIEIIVWIVRHAEALHHAL